MLHYEKRYFPNKIMSGRMRVVQPEELGPRHPLWPEPPAVLKGPDGKVARALNPASNRQHYEQQVRAGEIVTAAPYPSWNVFMQPREGEHFEDFKQRVKDDFVTSMTGQGGPEKRAEMVEFVEMVIRENKWSDIDYMGRWERNPADPFLDNPARLWGEFNSVLFPAGTSASVAVLNAGCPPVPREPREPRDLEDAGEAAGEAEEEVDLENLIA